MPAQKKKAPKAKTQTKPQTTLQLPRSFDAHKIEPAILRFWGEKDIYLKLKEKVKGKKYFYFLDGPPYTTGEIHVGHAWNKALKDAFCRYKRMAGFNVIDIPGFDMHGLPVEHKVEEKLGIKSKADIRKMGIATFVKECQTFSLEQMRPMIKDFMRMGVFLNWDNPYMTIKNEYIESAWWALKQTAENKHLYQGMKVMTWCPRCATVLAKHELDYKTIKEPSIYLKFPVLDKVNEFLIVWTTTPWTIPFNLAVMVHPEIDYVRAKTEDGEVWILAKALSTSVIQGVAGKKFKVVEDLKGEKLTGIRYAHPLTKEVPKLLELFNKNPKVHSVLLSSEYVTATSGSGLVHCAPGCGPEDYEVGQKHGIEPFNTIDEHGLFAGGGEFARWVAKKDDLKFIDSFKKKGMIIAEMPVEHEYAHCWRCANPVVFRTTEQWFCGVERMRSKLRQLNEKVTWNPDWGGKRWFDSWLENLRDWCISRQRYWGIPIPIWQCRQCKRKTIVGSKQELEKLSKASIADLHRPWIDEIELACDCGSKQKRIDDVFDVWFDSGAAPWAALGWPRNKAYEQVAPVDFILEGKDQIRGWFNSLLCLSMLAFGKPSYKAVYMHGFINDAQGRKMSKTLGNVISPYEVIDKYGADAMRHYLIGCADPGLDANYNFNDAQTKARTIVVLWNLHSYILQLAKELDVNPAELDQKVMEALCDVEERWMLSKLNSTNKAAAELYDHYRINEVPRALEGLFLTLSRGYVHMTRDKASGEDKDERTVVLYLTYRVLLDTVAMFSTIAPFVCEAIYQNLRTAFKLPEESICLFDWPKSDKKLLNTKLEQQMELATRVIGAIGAAREQAKLNLRWPCKLATVVSKPDVCENVEAVREIIARVANVRELHAHAELREVKAKIKGSIKAMEKEFGKELAAKLIAKLATESPANLLKKIEQGNKIILKADGQEYTLTKDHFIISRDIPKHLVEAEFLGGRVYLDISRNNELDSEGFAREIMRRVQAMRKKAGLQKTDRITLAIQPDEELATMLRNWLPKIQHRCGATKTEIVSAPPESKPKLQETVKIRDKQISIYFDLP